MPVEQQHRGAIGGRDLGKHHRRAGGRPELDGKPRGSGLAADGSRRLLEAGRCGGDARDVDQLDEGSDDRLIAGGDAGSSSMGLLDSTAAAATTSLLPGLSTGPAFGV
jgi:hypothetical protein